MFYIGTPEISFYNVLCSFRRLLETMQECAKILFSRTHFVDLQSRQKNAQIKPSRHSFVRFLSECHKVLKSNLLDFIFVDSWKLPRSPWIEHEAEGNFEGDQLQSMRCMNKETTTTVFEPSAGSCGNRAQWIENNRNVNHRAIQRRIDKKHVTNNGEAHLPLLW